MYFIEDETDETLPILLNNLLITTLTNPLYVTLILKQTTSPFQEEGMFNDIRFVKNRFGYTKLMNSFVTRYMHSSCMTFLNQLALDACFEVIEYPSQMMILSLSTFISGIVSMIYKRGVITT